MKRYYKYVYGNYISGIGFGSGGGVEITEEEYNTILSVIRAKPARTDTTDYKLTVDLNWEPYPVDPPSDEIDADEALAIIVGGDAE